MDAAAADFKQTPPQSQHYAIGSQIAGFVIASQSDDEFRTPGTSHTAIGVADAGDRPRHLPPPPCSATEPPEPKKLNTSSTRPGCKAVSGSASRPNRAITPGL
jgi:hypothetical protein